MANLYKVKSFSNNPAEGNLAGVVLNAQDLSESAMLAIAKEVGAAETAFILPSSKADLRIRWFTPNTEVGMCVHATMAALGIYKKHFSLSSAYIEAETKNIKLICQIREEDIFVKVSGYCLLPLELDCNQISALLSINSSRIVSNPCTVKIFDDAELIIEVASFNDLSKLTPTQTTYSEICHMLNVTGISLLLEKH